MSDTVLLMKQHVKIDMKAASNTKNLCRFVYKHYHLKGICL